MPNWCWPDRCDYELTKLQEVVGESLQYDADALERGYLILRFEWPLPGRIVNLEATYPASFPRHRPIVRLLSPPDQFPDRHCSPIDGVLCLLGRDSAQWVPELTLRQLLEDQLQNALEGTGIEDPQGEPAEFWWNCLCLPENPSYCLVDTSWDLGQHISGKIKLRGQFDWANGSPLVRAAALEISDEHGQLIAGWTGALPPEIMGSTTKALTIPWLRVQSPFLPKGGVDFLKQFVEAHPHLFQQRPVPLSLTHSLTACALVYETDLAFNSTGLGWAFPILFGANTRVKRRNSNKPPQGTLIRVLRGGDKDLGWRVPTVKTLRDKRVVVFGVGAIGGPLAIELARNGCRRIHLVDHDFVEPGNGIRWPLGATAWGRKKAAALSDWIQQQYPWSEPIAHDHQVGLQDDAALFKTILADVDMVIDAAASDGVTRLISDYCQRSKLPMVTVFSSPTLEGGLVARFGINGGCPGCLGFAWAGGRIAKPRGSENDAGLLQPPGCSERTFTGASYDLQELSLQAVRLIVDTLSDPASCLTSRIFTLALADDNGRIPPTWKVDTLDKNGLCECKQNQ